ncbi:transposase [Streptomyces sp. NRRL S-1448]|uniref:transposase n=1 Tax=Streptomyces sp. NRRL S-1448 TaxID=1463883 RepID=UPI00099CB53D
MITKNYPSQFKGDAVALYQSRPKATIRQVVADLGTNPETLRNWVRAADASRPAGRRAEPPTEPADAAGGGERRCVPEGPRAGEGTRDPGQGGEVFRRETRW